MTQVLAVDLGGTRVRFAIAEVRAGRVTGLDEARVYECADFRDFPSAHAQFASSLPGAAPTNMALAVAGPVHEGPFTLTNLSWTIDRAMFMSQLGLDHLVLLNDFVALGHAAAQLDAAWFAPISSSAERRANARVTTIIGPGTGLGVAQILRRTNSYDVIHSEGGHVGFAPTDANDDAVLAHARRKYPRVSAERVLSGPGLLAILEALPGRTRVYETDRALWSAALQGDDADARAALDHFTLSLGRFAGDMALTHGADAVLLAGGLSQRIFAAHSAPRFLEGIHDKGRFSARLRAIPVSLITHPQPGLYGAAAAFAQETQS